MGCQSVREQFGEQFEGVRGAEAQAHLAACSACRAAQASWARMHRVLTEMPTVTAPDDLLAAVMDALPEAPVTRELPHLRFDWLESMGFAVSFALVAALAGPRLTALRASPWQEMLPLAGNRLTELSALVPTALLGQGLLWSAVGLGIAAISLWGTDLAFAVAPSRSR